MKPFVTAEEYALAHYYLKDVQCIPNLDEACDHYRHLALRHMPEDRVSLLRRPGLQFVESDFSDEIIEISHYLQKNLK